MSPPGPRDFKPRQAGKIDWGALHVSAEEGFLLTRIDGSTSLTELCHLTNLKPEQVRQAVSKLVRQGVVESAGIPGEVMAPAAPWAETAPAAPEPRAAPTPDPAAEAPDDEALEERDEVTAPDLQIPAHLLEDAEAPAPPPALLDPALLQPVDDDAETPAAAAAPEAAPAQPAASEPAAAEPEPAPEQAALSVDEGNYRKLFETQLHPLPDDVRQARAQQASGPELLAFCYDPHPGVIRAVLENARSGLDHGRLVAFAHRTGMGLELLTHRPELFRDGVVQRRLLGNIQLPEPMFKRMAGNKRLQDLFKLGNDRDVTEKVRSWSRNALRQRWNTAAADERVEFLFQTEGRALAVLSGATFDSQTTTLMCRRQFHSTLLIQNLARFPATTPPIILHLLRQPVVKRQQHLRTMLLQHPNTPSDAKRRQD